MEIALHPLINNYVNDFLSIPLVLKISQLICEKFIYQKKINFTFSLIIAICMYWSLLFEVIFSKILSRYTTDYLDIFAYFVGGIVYYLIEKYENNKMFKMQ